VRLIQWKGYFKRVV